MGTKVVTKNRAVHNCRQGNQVIHANVHEKHVILLVSNHTNNPKTFIHQ